MSEIPKTLADLPRFAGKITDVESPMISLLPKGATLVVAGTYQKRLTYHSSNCLICGLKVWMSERDVPIIATMATPVILCPECYFKMEPQEPSDGKK